MIPFVDVLIASHVALINFRFYSIIILFTSSFMLLPDDLSFSYLHGFNVRCFFF